MKKAIDLGGSSIKNFSYDNGKSGSFQQKFNVYGKLGQKCSNSDCNHKIIKTKMFNRASFFVAIAKNNKVDPYGADIYIV